MPFYLEVLMTSATVFHSAPSAVSAEVLSVDFPEPHMEALWNQTKATLFKVAIVVSFIAVVVFFGLGAASAALNFCFANSLAHLVVGFLALAALSCTTDFADSWQNKAEHFHSIQEELEVIENYTHAQMFALLDRNEIDLYRITLDITARPFKILVAHYLHHQKHMQKWKQTSNRFHAEGRRTENLASVQAYRYSTASLENFSWPSKIAAANILQRIYRPAEPANAPCSYLPMTFEQRQASRIQLGERSPYIKFNRQPQLDITVADMEAMSIRQLHQRMFQRV